MRRVTRRSQAIRKFAFNLEACHSIVRTPRSSCRPSSSTPCNVSYRSSCTPRSDPNTTSARNTRRIHTRRTARRYTPPIRTRASSRLPGSRLDARTRRRTARSRRSSVGSAGRKNAILFTKQPTMNIRGNLLRAAEFLGNLLRSAPTDASAENKAGREDLPNVTVLDTDFGTIVILATERNPGGTQRHHRAEALRSAGIPARGRSEPVWLGRLALANLRRYSVLRAQYEQTDRRVPARTRRPCTKRTRPRGGHGRGILVGVGPQ